jgi:hypothetical protein
MRFFFIRAISHNIVSVSQYSREFCTFWDSLSLFSVWKFFFVVDRLHFGFEKVSKHSMSSGFDEISFYKTV